jgi:hypothetical protein
MFTVTHDTRSTIMIPMSHRRFDVMAISSSDISTFDA